MDQKQLSYFIAVAKYRNFSRAAQDFYLTQPAISHQIKMLEKELDTELFVRNTRKVTLTDSGELFLEDAKIILDAMEHAKQKVTLAKEQPSVLRISHLSAPTHQFFTRCRKSIPHSLSACKDQADTTGRFTDFRIRRSAGCRYLFFYDAGFAANCLAGCLKKSSRIPSVWLLGKIIRRFRK